MEIYNPKWLKRDDMKRYLLFTIALILGGYLTAQIAPTATLTAVKANDEYYHDDCDDEEEFVYFTEIDAAREESLRIYPNPTTEYISVTDNSSVEYLYIYNIIGRRVMAFPVVSGVQYSLRDLPDGMYLVSMVDEAGKILKTVRTSKMVLRP